MIASRSTRAFQLIALALVFSLAQVYVIGRTPSKANTDPKASDKSSVSQPKGETAVIDAEDRNATAPSAASEKMPLTAGTKTMLTRIFSKNNVEARIATRGSFLDVKASAGNIFKPRASLVSPQPDDDDDDDDGSKSTWIAVGIIAAVLTIAIIGLRADRNRN